MGTVCCERRGDAMPEFGEWESFYLIVGGAAGALIGLQFVVMTLVAARPSIAGAGGQSAFATPTIVHFSASLLIAATQRAPWQSFTVVATLWAVIGVSGIVYTAVIARRMRRQNAYRAGARGLAVSLAAAVRRLRAARARRYDRASAHARCAVRRRHGCAGAAVHRHPQRVGLGRVPRDSEIRDRRDGLTARGSGAVERRAGSLAAARVSRRRT